MTATTSTTTPQGGETPKPDLGSVTIDGIPVAVPKGTELPMQPACEADAIEGLGEKVRDWWRSLTQRQ